MPDAGHRGAVLRGRFELLVEAFLPNGEAYVLRDRSGAALWVPPGIAMIGEDEAEALGERLEKVSGENAGRFFELDALKEEHHPEAACLYLAIMGVVPQRQGRGLGTALLDPVLQRCDAGGTPAYLEATSAGSRRLYQRHGFETVGEIALPDGPSLWPMWREPVQPDARPALDEASPTRPPLLSGGSLWSHSAAPSRNLTATLKQHP